MKNPVNNKKFSEDLSAVIFGGGIFYIYYNIFFRTIFGSNRKMEILLAGIFVVLGGIVGKSLRKFCLKMSKKQRRNFIWIIIIIVVITSILGFILTKG